MNPIPFSELNKIYSIQKYKYIGLYDLNGNCIEKTNSHKDSSESRLRQIEVRINVLPDGIYVVKCKNSPRNDVKPDEFFIKKGDVSEAINIMSNSNIVDESAKNVLSYDRAIQMNKEIADLTAKVSVLESELSTKDDYILEIESSMDEVEVTNDAIQVPLQDGKISLIKEFGSELIAASVPILSEFFNLRKESLALEARKVALEEAKFLQKNSTDSQFINYFKNIQNAAGPVDISKHGDAD